MRHVKTALIAASLLVFGVVVPALFPAPAAAQATTRYIPLQGQLTNQAGEPITDGTYSLAIRIYSVPDGGAEVWNDVYEELPVINGTFNLLIGSQKPVSQVNSGSLDLLDLLSQSGILYVGITVTEVNNSAVASAVEMRPRLSLLPVPFAQEAGDAAKFDGKGFAQLFDPATNSALKAVRADNLDGFDWSDVLTVDGGSAPANDPTAAGNQIRSELLPPSADLSQVVPAGTIVRAYGALANAAIDPTSLDSDSDGVPDRPLSEGKTINGVTPTGSIVGSWFVCRQNPAGNLVFPNDSTVDDSLKGVLVPSYGVAAVNPAVQGSGGGTYAWRQVLPDSTTIDVPSSTLYRGMAYDPIAKGYFFFDTTTSKSTISFLYLSGSKYIVKPISLPAGFTTNWRTSTGFQSYVMTQAGSTTRYLINTGAAIDVYKTRTSGVVITVTGETPNDIVLTSYNSWGFPNGGSGCGASLQLPFSFSTTAFGENKIYDLGGYPASTTSLATNCTTIWNFTGGLAPSATVDNGTVVPNLNSTAGFGGGFVSGAVVLSPYDNNLYLYGGVVPTGGTYINAMAKCNLNSNPISWSVVTNSGDAPPAITEAISCVSPTTKGILLWGGLTSGGAHTNPSFVWEHNPQASSWTKKVLTSYPAARAQASYCYDSDRGTLVMVGGYGPQGSATPFAEMWELDLGLKLASDCYVIKVK